ncbi:MAG TPA: PLP-dependent aminotransferase family protein [Micromonosporaceae bacterium]|jgi:DNA-binding transcriptional MocR family regulator
MASVLRGSQLARLLGHWRPTGISVSDYVALADTVRGLLVDGRLALGVRLPAERELAETLEISRTTVTAAYAALRESGHLRSRRGAGSWTTLPGGTRLASTGLWAPDSTPDLLDLGQAALAAPAELPAAATEAVAALPRYMGGAGYHPTGIPELRAAVAAEYAARGLPTTTEQIMVTSGVQHALDLVVRLLLPPGGSVTTESPTYPNALASFAGRRARVHTYGLGSDGWDEDLLLATIRQSGSRIAYLIPEFQNPTGHLMPERLRAQLPGAAHAAGTDLVIDESFVDLDFGDIEVPPPVAVYDRHARVLSIGGMSKPYWGGLRIGWIRAAEPVVQRLAAVRVGMDMAGPVLDQLVAVALLRRAPEIVAARRVQLRQQRDVLVEALRRELPAWRFTVPDGGVTLWAELDAPISSALSRAAEAFGVRLAPGPRFGLDGTLERFLRLPFTLPPAELEEAVTRIVAARDDLQRGTRRTWETPALVA